MLMYINEDDGDDADAVPVGDRAAAGQFAVDPTHRAARARRVRFCLDAFRLRGRHAGDDEGAAPPEQPCRSRGFRLDGGRRGSGRAQGARHQEHRLMSVFASFVEELEARTAIEDCLKKFARAVDRQDWQAARTRARAPRSWPSQPWRQAPAAALPSHADCWAPVPTPDRNRQWRGRSRPSN